MLKKIASNTLAQLVAKFFGAGLTLFTTYYTIRLTGLELYGDLTKILVLVAIGFTAIDFGLNAEAIRFGTSESKMRQVLGQVILVRLVLSALVILALNLLIFFLPGGYSSEVKSIFWLGSLAIIFQGIYTSGNAWFQSNLSYWRPTISVVVGSLTGTGLTLYFLATSPTLSHLVLANTIGYSVMALCSVFMLCTSGALAPEKCLQTRSSLGGLLRRSLILGLILIASVFASKLDTIILGIFRLSSEVGEYGFAYRIFDVILVLPVFVMNAVYPLLIKDSGNSSKLISHTTKNMAFIGVATAIFLWFAAPYVNLVKPGLTLTVSVLRLLSLSLPLFYVTAPLMWSLIGARRDKIVLSVYVVAALGNGLLNLLFIPSFGAPAAAAMTGITELFIFCALLYFSRNDLRT
ncbi:MAG: oligosaccharide flippase family protein [bacterium]